MDAQDGQDLLGVLKIWHPSTRLLWMDVPSAEAPTFVGMT